MDEKIKKEDKKKVKSEKTEEIPCNTKGNDKEEKELKESIKEYDTKVVEQYIVAFSIDYTDSDKYLVQGKQSQKSDPEKLNKLYSGKKDLDYLKSIFQWLKSEFPAYRARENTIGRAKVELDI